MKGGTIAQAQDIPLRFLENILDVLEVVTLADVVERVLPPSVVKLTEGEHSRTFPIPGTKYFFSRAPGSRTERSTVTRVPPRRRCGCGCDRLEYSPCSSKGSTSVCGVVPFSATPLKRSVVSSMRVR
ncbi:MAG: hypothetical protein AABM43_12365 [Actinomycetota bacterium]